MPSFSTLLGLALLAVCTPSLASEPDNVIFERLLQIDHDRVRRAKRSSIGLGVSGLAQVGVGSAIVAMKRPDAGVLGMGLGASQSIFALSGGLQTARKSLAYRGQISAIVQRDLGPAAAFSLVDKMQLDLQRETRRHAFATGLGVGLIGGGLAFAFLDREQTEPAGVVAALSGLSFSFHHLLRWHTCNRLGNDLAILRARTYPSHW